MKTNNISRREFGKNIISTGTALGLGCMGLAKCIAPQKVLDKLISIQLYTVRELCNDDFFGTLRKVADIGYDAFEFAGYDGIKAKDLKAFIDELGVVCSGTHTRFEELEGDLQKTIDFNLELNNKHIICPSMPDKYREKGAENVKLFAEKMNFYGEAIKKADMQLYYHNHAFEFEKVDGKYLYDHLLENTQSDLVLLEADLYWVKRGGLDPIEFMNTYRDRCKILHMKDMAGDEKQSFAPVGTGILDFPGIVKTAKDIGVEWFVVEQDQTVKPVLEAISISYHNMYKLLNL